MTPEPRNRPKSRHAGRQRVERAAPLTMRNWEAPPPDHRVARQMEPDTVIECGWGRLIFGHTFDNHQKIVDLFRDERERQRDIAFYLRDPHVLLAQAPQELFLDPSHTFRLWLDQYRPAHRSLPGVIIRKAIPGADADAINRILLARGMVPIEPGFLHANARARTLVFLVAEETATGAIAGFTMGVDHKRAFNDPEQGSSLWSLTVDPQANAPGVGEALVRKLAEVFKGRGRAFMDLSVMHDNEQAIALYRKLGFRRAPVFAVKYKNSINEKLYTGPHDDEPALNPYAKLLVDEARRRGIAVEVLDAENGYFRLSQGGREIVCRESLTELTSAIAMSRCDDKGVTRKLMEKEGLSVPAQHIVADDEEALDAFLEHHPRVVVKPARGEQGAGITVDISDRAEIGAAIEAARRHCDKVIVEEFVEGEDLRLIVIDFKLVAGAIRKPAQVRGNGRDSVRKLVEKQSRRRAAATDGESTIPMDEETERCLGAQGYGWDDVPPPDERILCRKTANLHTGGTIHDVTDRLHPALVSAAVKAARAIDIPVVGLDFIVPSVTEGEYRIIEANERPGLANHEPQPTAERFIDMLFPQIAAR